MSEHTPLTALPTPARSPREIRHEQLEQAVLRLEALATRLNDRFPRRAERPTLTLIKGGE
jgi:hypothetical protein